MNPATLKVVAYKNGKKWATDIVKTTGPATKLALKADRDKIHADGKDLSFVTVTSRRQKRFAGAALNEPHPIQH